MTGRSDDIAGLTLKKFIVSLLSRYNQLPAVVPGTAPYKRADLQFLQKLTDIWKWSDVTTLLESQLESLGDLVRLLIFEVLGIR